MGFERDVLCETCSHSTWLPAATSLCVLLSVSVPFSNPSISVETSSFVLTRPKILHEVDVYIGLPQDIIHEEHLSILTIRTSIMFLVLLCTFIVVCYGLCKLAMVSGFMQGIHVKKQTINFV